MTPEQTCAGALQRACAGARFCSLGIAVSGGGDSMALLQLAHDWAGAHEVSLAAVTVDHGLRPEAADEAALVAKTCAGLGVSHEILHWKGWDGQGNLQDAARRARYRLIGEWAQGQGVGVVALGHTLDDQAETFVMRLARGSGVDGLSAMRADWQGDGVRWLRPLLGARRHELRDYLAAKNVTWADDPTNDDMRFDRVKSRRALELLAPLGIDAGRLADTARHMTLARAALQHYAAIAARDLCRVQGGDVLIDAALAGLVPETRYRLFAQALIWVASAPYRPRLEALLDTLDDVMAGARRTLHGCLISAEGGAGGGAIRISREYNAVKDAACAPDQLWDRRWRLRGPHAPGLQIRALGEAVSDCPGWRQSGLPRASLMASPAIWQGEALIAAPLAGLANGWSAQIRHESGDFPASFLSH